jgi:hypothetical protein
MSEIRDRLEPRLHEVVSRICTAIYDTTLIIPLTPEQVSLLTQRMESKMIDCASAFLVEIEVTRAH